MGLRERDRTGTEHQEGTPAPRPAGRLRRPLALVAALGALIAFATLTRPAASPSARLTIGSEGNDGTDRAAGGERERAAGADDPAREAVDSGDGGGGAQWEAMLRPLDPATLADVPANILTLGRDEWPSSSEDGELLAVLSHSGPGGGEVRVVAARTLQLVATVDVDGPLTGFHGFTPDAEALVVQVRRGNRQMLVRLPLDPGQPVAEVALPAGVDNVGPPGAMLTGGQVALVVADLQATVAGGEAPPPRVLVVDLTTERLALDLPLPAGPSYAYGSPAPDASIFEPGLAWDAARERLYVVHADAPRVTVVDLATGTVLADAEVGPPMAELGDEPAHRWRWAEVSPDGSRLYTAGSQSRPASTSVQPLGLTVIDTQTLTEVAHMSRVAGLMLSPDGRWLLWTAADVRSSGDVDPGYPGAPRGVALMDTAQLGLVTLLGGPGAHPLGFSGDSAHVYLQREEEGEQVVVAHALPSLARTGERRLPRGSWFDPFSGLLGQEA